MLFDNKTTTHVSIEQLGKVQRCEQIQVLYKYNVTIDVCTRLKEWWNDFARTCEKNANRHLSLRGRHEMSLRQRSKITD